jgi:hypothetical protein
MIKLSNNTLEILKNLASINQNLQVKANEPLRTISVAQNIFAKAEVEEVFPSTFGIYDLNEFISVVDLVQDPELSFERSRVSLKNGNSRASYAFADESILCLPKKDIRMPEAEVHVSVTNEMLTRVRKAASVLRHSVLSFKGEDGKIILSVLDNKNATQNTFDIVIDENNPCKDSFDLQFLIPNLKVMAGDYDVKISSKLISHWKNKNTPIEYFISLEKTSSFDKQES